MSFSITIFCKLCSFIINSIINWQIDRLRNGKNQTPLEGSSGWNTKKRGTAKFGFNYLNHVCIFLTSIYQRKGVCGDWSSIISFLNIRLGACPGVKSWASCDINENHTKLPLDLTDSLSSSLVKPFFISEQTADGFIKKVLEKDRLCNSNVQLAIDTYFF